MARERVDARRRGRVTCARALLAFGVLERTRGARGFEYVGNGRSGKVCSNTIGEVANKCNATEFNGLCHSWFDRAYRYRGTWVNELVFIHRQGGGGPQGNDYDAWTPWNDSHAYMKTMYFTGPALASITSCAEDFGDRGDKIIQGAAKHVRFHLADAHNYDATNMVNVELLMPDDSWRDFARQSTVPTSAVGSSSWAKLGGISFGADIHGVRDLVNFNYNVGSRLSGDAAQVGSQLMYNIFTYAHTLNGLAWRGDPQMTADDINIAQSKNVSVGDFKFNYGLHLNSGYTFPSSATHIRIKFTLETVKFNSTTDRTWHNITSAGQLTRVNYYAQDEINRRGETITNLANGTNVTTFYEYTLNVSSTFGLDFSGKFQYGVYNENVASYSSTTDDAKVTLSGDNSTVYVDLPISTGMKTALAGMTSVSGTKFLILYDPELETFETRPSFPSESKSNTVVIAASAAAGSVVVAVITYLFFRRRRRAAIDASKTIQP